MTFGRFCHRLLLRPVLGFVLCFLLGIAGSGMPLALAANCAPATEDTQDVEEDTKVAARPQSSRSSQRKGRGAPLLDRPAFTLAASAQSLSLKHSASLPSDSQAADPCGNGLGCRLRC